MELEQHPKIGDLLLALIQEVLPSGTHKEMITKYHSYCSRILSSNLSPAYNYSIESTTSKMNRKLQGLKSPDKMQKVERLHLCLQKLSMKKGPFTKLNSVLRMIYSISEGPMTKNTGSGTLFSISNIKKRQERKYLAKQEENARIQRRSTLARTTVPRDSTASTFMTRRTKVDSNEIKLQKSIVRELLFIFQGVDSRFFIYEQRKGQFYIDPNLELFACKKRMIIKLCQLGWLYNKVQAFLKLQTNTIKGLIFQSLCYSVKEELNEYFRLIAILENLRDSEEGYKLNLKRLYLWTLQPFERLKWIAILTDSCKTLKGGQLLSALYSYSSHGSLQIKELANRILKKTLAPFMNFMKMWVYSGELIDPMGEFFIEQSTETLNQDQFWNRKYKIRKDMIPSFMTVELAKIILVAGKTKTFMRKFCGDGEWRLRASFITVENLISFEYMEGSKFKAFQNWAQNIKQESDLALRRTVVEKFQFMDHFKMIKNYLLLGQGDFMNTLMENLQTELSQTASKIFKHNIALIIESTKTSTSAQNQDKEFLDRVGVKLLDPEPGAIGWDIFSLDYRLDSPLTTIFNREIMLKYLTIFNFLWRVKRLEYWLNNIWILHKKNCQLGITPDILSSVNICNLIRHQMLHFVKTFFSYLMLEVIETEWNHFVSSIEKVESLDEIIQRHEKFVENVLEKSMLSDHRDSLKREIMKLLHHIGSFKHTQDVIFVNLQEQQQKAQDIEKRTYSFEDDSDEEDMLTAQKLDLEEMKKNYRDVFAKTNKLINDIWTAFILGFERFLDMLSKKQNMKMLSFKLDFNEYYKYNRMGGTGVQNYENFMEGRGGGGFGGMAGGGAMDME